MARRKARLQVPVDQTMLDQLQELADALGFDSVPAMIRFWAKAELNSRGRPPELNQPNGIVLRYVELILALNPQPRTVDMAYSNLLRLLQRHKMKDLLRGLSHPPTSDRIFGT